MGATAIKYATKQILGWNVALTSTHGDIHDSIIRNVSLVILFIKDVVLWKLSSVFQCATILFTTRMSDYNKYHLWHVCEICHGY